MRNGTLKTIGLVACTMLVCACSSSAELSPEMAAHLGEYEQLIEDYESKFDKVRNDPPAFAKVAESYRQQAQAWIDEWVTVAPDLSDDEGKAIQAAIAKLNRRATKMLTGTS